VVIFSDVPQFRYRPSRAVVWWGSPRRQCAGCRRFVGFWNSGGHGDGLAFCERCAARVDRARFAAKPEGAAA
jgi:hypothetical protein